MTTLVESDTVTLRASLASPPLTASSPLGTYRVPTESRFEMRGMAPRRRTHSDRPLRVVDNGGGARRLLRPAESPQLRRRTPTIASVPDGVARWSVQRGRTNTSGHG